MPDRTIRQQILSQARQIVVKVGTNAICDDSGRLETKTVRGLARQMAKLMKADRRVTLVASGAIGAGLAELDLPDPEAVLTDPTGFQLPDRGDRAYAVLMSVAAAVAAEATPQRWAAGWQVLGRAGERVPDVAAMAARSLVRCRPDGAATPPEAAVFLPLLRDAGLA